MCLLTGHPRAVAGAQLLCLFWSCYFEMRMLLTVFGDDFQPVNLEEAAKGPVAGLTVRFFARAPGPGEAPDTREPEIALHAIEVSAGTSVDQASRRLHCSAQRADECCIDALNTLGANGGLEFSNAHGDHDPTSALVACAAGR